jgi:hypothetical protein
MKLFFILFGVILLSGCIGEKTQELYDSYSRANNRDVAISFVKHTDLYKMEGGTRLECVDAGQFNRDGVVEMRCTFKSTIDTNITHVMDITLVDGVVDNAVLDGKISMLL